MQKEDVRATFDFQKSLKEVPTIPFFKYFKVDRYINRPLASLIVRLVFPTRILPNHLTYFAFFLGICGSIAYIGGQYRNFLIGGILVFVSTLFDSADGMLARSKNLSSRYGAYLDLFLDRITDFLVFACICIGYYRYSHQLTFAIISFFALAAYFLEISLYYLVKEFKGSMKSGEGGEERGMVYFGILIFSLLNRLDVMIIILILVPVFYISYKIIEFIHLGHEK